MYLSELIEELSKHDLAQRVANGFENPHSWRGDYSQLAFEPCGQTTVGAMLEAAKSALGSTYAGWKGGDYVMNEWSDCYLAQRGDCGESIGPTLLRYMLADEVANRDDLAAHAGAHLACPDCGEAVPVALGTPQIDDEGNMTVDLEIDDVWAHAWTHGIAGPR